MRSKRIPVETIPSHHGMPSKWIDRSSMVWNMISSQNFFAAQLGKDCVRRLCGFRGVNWTPPRAQSQEVVRVGFLIRPDSLWSAVKCNSGSYGRNNFSVAGVNEVCEAAFVAVPNGTDTQLLAQILRV